MKPEISEFSFGYAVTESFIWDNTLPIQAAPFFPSLKHTKKFLDEVIVHELLHLKYPNHEKMFKVLMKTYLGMR